jgi:multidrug efflux system membrane fusion protein
MNRLPSRCLLPSESDRRNTNVKVFYGLIGAVLVAAGSPVLRAGDFPAVLDWGRRLELSTPISGVVSAVTAREGQQVEAGQVLVELDDRAFRAGVAKARAELAESRQRLAEAERELERARELYERTVLSTHELQLAEISLTGARADQQRAAAALVQAEMNLEYSRVRAPFDGLVIRVPAQVGQTVVNQLQAQPLVVLVDDRNMRLRARIEENWLGRLQPGSKVRVGLGGEWFEGRIERLGFEPLAETAQGPVYELEVSVAPGDGWRQGQEGVVRINE